MSKPTAVAIIGSGNIDTDLMIKIKRLSTRLERGIMVGIDSNSDGLARARRFGFAAASDGIDGCRHGTGSMTSVSSSMRRPQVRISRMTLHCERSRRSASSISRPPPSARLWRRP